MLVGTTVFKNSDAKFVEMDGMGAGTAASAGLVEAGQSHGLQTGFTRMENVTIPRQARVEEVLHVISGSIDVEDNGTTRTVFPGDSIFLTADAAPTYHVKEETVILWALTGSGETA